MRENLRQRIADEPRALTPERSLAEVPGRIGTRSRSRRECRGNDRGNQSDDADEPRRISLHRAPRSFEISRDAAIAPRQRKPRTARDQRGDRCGQWRSRRNTKAANGGPKTTTDG